MVTNHRTELTNKVNIFCEKTTVLAEKVFHLAAGEAQLNFCHMLKFTLSSWIVISSFVIEIFKKTLPLAEAKCVFRYRYVLKLYRIIQKRDMAFDPSKTTDVETMTNADFSVWRTSKQHEVRPQIFRISHLSFRSPLRKQPDQRSTSQAGL